MKTITTKCLWVVAALATMPILSRAQNAVGSWKKTNDEVTHKDGKTTSTFKMISKRMPCFADIVYMLSADGKINEDAKACSPALQKQVEGELQGAHWKLLGDKLIIDIADKSLPFRHEQFHIRFNGNDEMVWTFVYSENPSVPNITGARQMQSTFKRTTG